jgi:membrane-associated phospholipid phosphatase
MMYLVLNIPQSTLHVLQTSLDKQIPRVPIFSIPYLAFLPWLYGTLIYAWLKNRYFRQMAISFILINLVAFVVYLTFQTYVPRDPITSHDLFSGILQFIYNNDQPYAGFPSLHSALSASMATYFVCSKSKWSWAAVAMAALVVVSTLFTKQHFVLDAISGVTLGVVVTWVTFKVFSIYSEKSS